MSGKQRQNLIKRLQADLPRGGPFGLDTLAQFEVSPTRAASYAKSGWLLRLAHGTYAFPNDPFGVHGALLFLQKQVPGFHVAGKTALGWQGVRHNLRSREQLVLWGDARFVLPVWFTERFPARYAHTQLFDWPHPSLAEKTVITPPGFPEGLRVASPERAVLELLYEAGTKESLEEARNLFDGFRSPRKELLSQLLACCKSVKTVRLFFTWARETNVVNVEELLNQNTFPTGSTKRWVSRLDDGTLLTLNPHG